MKSPTVSTVEMAGRIASALQAHFDIAVIVEKRTYYRTSRRRRRLSLTPTSVEIVEDATGEQLEAVILDVLQNRNKGAE